MQHLFSENGERLFKISKVSLIVFAKSSIIDVWQGPKYASACCALIVYDGGPYHVETSLDLLCKSMDWFLYDRDLRHERVKYVNTVL